MTELNPGDVFFYRDELFRVSRVSENYVYTGGNDDYFRRDKASEVFKITEITQTITKYYS
jgi:hypothetical protein